MNPRRTQLFLDDEIIEQTVRLRRIIHQPQKHPANPLYTVGAPWEGQGIVYLAGVYVDPQDGLWKAWYVTLYPPAYPEIIYAICLITSPDGIHWTRPELDVYRGHNGEKTNIVLDLGKVGSVSGSTILYEPERAPTPWTLIFSASVYGTTHYKGYILRSADGVHWGWERPMPHGVDHGMGDRCTALQGHRPGVSLPAVQPGAGRYAPVGIGAVGASGSDQRGPRREQPSAHSHSRSRRRPRRAGVPRLRLSVRGHLRRPLPVVLGDRRSLRRNGVDDEPRHHHLATAASPPDVPAALTGRRRGRRFRSSDDGHRALAANPHVPARTAAPT